MLEINTTSYESITEHHTASLPRDDSDSDYGDDASLREQTSLREVDAESLIAPILSRSQSTVRYAAAVTEHEHPEPVSASSSDDEAAGGVREFRRPSHSKARAVILHAALPRPRPQTSSGNDVDTTSTVSKKASKPLKSSFSLPFQLPSLPSLPSLPKPFGSETMSERYKRHRSKTLQFQSSSQNPLRSSTFFSRPREAAAIASPAPPLRRSSSAGSLSRLSLARAATAGSTVSSLGDDTKFRHIHTMTNSRLKAIKDNLLAGFPTMPPLPHIQQHFANLNPFTDTLETPLMPRSPAIEALDNLIGDVVVLGGYRGSILRDTASGRRVWIPLKVGFNLRKVDLELGLDPADELHATDKIIPDGMLKSVSGVDISRRLIRRFRNNAAQHDRRVHDYGYDWRLSPALLTNQFITFLETLPCNQPGRKKNRGALVIAHSLGGLIVRSAINQRPELFSGVLFAGSPNSCINILGPLKNGDSVMFNSKVFTAQVNFTLRTSYVFLPEDGRCFIDKRTGKHLPLNLFNVADWRAYGLSPCVSDLPPESPPPLVSLSVLHKKDHAVGTGVPQLSTSSTFPTSSSSDPPPIPKDQAVKFLTRVLAETAEFRKGLNYRPELERQYPPMTVMYSKTTPTVRGAYVDGYEAIKGSGLYDNLAFGAGDGVCLAREAMLPEGYRCARKVAVDRGHVSLLGELEGVGRCVEAIVRDRGW